MGLKAIIARALTVEGDGCCLNARPLLVFEDLLDVDEWLHDSLGGDRVGRERLYPGYNESEKSSGVSSSPPSD